ncbi:MAG: hypothetical protein IPK21_14425 [Haliscomenobacter sp.]|nr:hypothetical protein [Haliscomenobacter sp.]
MEKTLGVLSRFRKINYFFQHRIIQAVFAENPEFKDLSKEYIRSFYDRISKREIEIKLEEDGKLGSHAAIGAYAVQGN